MPDEAEAARLFLNDYDPLPSLVARGIASADTPRTDERAGLSEVLMRHHVVEVGGGTATGAYFRCACGETDIRNRRWPLRDQANRAGWDHVADEVVAHMDQEGTSQPAQGANGAPGVPEGHSESQAGTEARLDYEAYLRDMSAAYDRVMWRKLRGALGMGFDQAVFRGTDGDGEARP